MTKEYVVYGWPAGKKDWRHETVIGSYPTRQEAEDLAAQAPEGWEAEVETYKQQAPDRPRNLLDILTDLPPDLLLQGDGEPVQVEDLLAEPLGPEEFEPRYTLESDGIYQEGIKNPVFRFRPADGAQWYQVVNYFDIWGNPRDGWEVNNLAYEALFISIGPEDGPQEILEKLIDLEFLVPEAKDLVEILEPGPEFFEIEAKADGYPLGRLEPVEEWSGRRRPRG